MAAASSILQNAEKTSKYLRIKTIVLAQEIDRPKNQKYRAREKTPRKRPRERPRKIFAKDPENIVIKAVEKAEEKAVEMAVKKAVEKPVKKAVMSLNKRPQTF